MSYERDIDEVLRSLGDSHALALWRRTCRELASGPRLGIAALTSSAASTVSQELSGLGLGTVVLGYDPDEQALDAPPAVRDALFGVHAALWATPAAQPLGARERAALERLGAATGVAQRAVLVVQPEVLARLSDAPEVELAEIRERLQALVPPGWSVLVQGDEGVQAFLAGVRTDLDALTVERLRAVARRLLDDVRAELHGQVSQHEAAVARNESALQDEDRALDAARAEGQRAAAHTLGVLRRRTEELLLDLRAFLRDLEADLRPQIEALADVEEARRVTPHWLEHLVQGWLRDRLAAWRVQVHGDLDGLALRDAALAHAELLLPALQPAPMPGEGRWRRAVGLSAGVGGAAVLMAMQLWIPALVAVASGVAWSAWDREQVGVRQDRLVEQATAAVQQLGLDADRVLTEQLIRFEDQLATLADTRVQDLESERAEVRAALQARLRLHRARHEDAMAALDAFVERVAALE